MRAGRWLIVGMALASVAAPASAAAKTHTFDGRCSFKGSVHFTPPATNTLQSLTTDYQATGTCTGKLDGRQITNARVRTWNIARKVNGSCPKADTTRRGHGTLAFPDGSTIPFSSEFHFVGTHGEFSIYGKRGGSARGLGSFVTDRTPPTLAAQCAGDGVSDAPLDLTLVTDSPMRGQADGRGRTADFRLGLTSRKPGTPTGMRVSVLLHRLGDRNAKASPLRSAVIRGPRGLRFDTTAVPQCTASDQQLKLLGQRACPANTKLAVGSFSAMTGFGPPVDPLAGENHVFNGPRQLIEVITSPGGAASPAFDRLTIKGSTLTAHPPKAPGGPPEGESSVRSIGFAIPVRGSGRKTLIRTPRRCPRSRRWVTRATFGFADGSRETVASATPCKRRKRR